MISGIAPKTMIQMAKSANTRSMAPRVASARAKVFAGSHALPGSSTGVAIAGIGVTESTSVEKSVRLFKEFIWPVSCSTCVRTFVIDASTFRISSIVFARARSAR